MNNFPKYKSLLTYLFQIVCIFTKCTKRVQIGRVELFVSYLNLQILLDNRRTSYLLFENDSSVYIYYFITLNRTNFLTQIQHKSLRHRISF
jgi:hypothetical protein